MHSTLIRYTSSKYKDSILAGDLYLSSLSTFWDIKKYKLNYDDVKNGNYTEDEIKQAIMAEKTGQQDFSEGVSAQVPHDVLDDIGSPFKDYIIHDARFRVEAYGYCNLLCFFRIDGTQISGNIPLNTDSIARLALEKGIPGIETYKDVEQLPKKKLSDLLSKIVEPNPLMNPEYTHIVQLPHDYMDGFGDMVMVVKDESAFTDRVIQAVEQQGGHCITGDVRYHDLQDRIDASTMSHHCISVISGDGRAEGHLDGLFNLNRLLHGRNDIIRYGCLDKYSRYSFQKEWRICWLPQEHNYNPKILQVGDLTDIIDIVDAKNIRQYLLKLYRGYFPGIISETRKKSKGTINYERFKQEVEGIDGKCRIIFELG